MINEFEYPIFNKIVVKIIGSKKYVNDPINLEKVVGSAIEKIALIFFLFGIKSFFSILNFGNLIKKIMMEENSHVWREIYESAYGMPLYYKK